ncbi:MAG: bifunctional phosphoserine phosphatase/homoserine phosphotransferase ThrH [Gammaproteobacteria bacterium AqS3]|nr:bifunctional phosphoserine phosphatase/homoserine phosphotransferase ThrH [Gammaproteobacteria bacterium AqS3]
MKFVCLDMEGVLTPEIWKQVARATGIEKLAMTTRDVADYDELMRMRLHILESEGLGIAVLQDAVAELGVLPGAVEFVEWVRGRCQFAVISDTFYDIAAPLLRQLGSPTLFCNRLEVAPDGRITGYSIRQSQQKLQVIRALQGLNYPVLAAGDSHNDLGMLQQADIGCWFRPPEDIAQEYAQFEVLDGFDELRARIEAWMAA